jgi:hypothetical protein
MNHEQILREADRGCFRAILTPKSSSIAACAMSDMREAGTQGKVLSEGDGARVLTVRVARIAKQPEAWFSPLGKMPDTCTVRECGEGRRGHNSSSLVARWPSISNL